MDVPAGSTLLRIHAAGRDALWVGPAPGSPPTHRFDAPAGEYRVCYPGPSAEACFAETFLRNPPVRILSLHDPARRSLAGIGAVRPLRLVPLRGPALARLGATAQVSSGPCALSRAWALTLWAHPEAPDGVQYRSRHDGAELRVARFDRAADALEVRATRELAEPRFLAAPSRRYGFGITA